MSEKAFVLTGDRLTWLIRLSTDDGRILVMPLERYHPLCTFSIGREFILFGIVRQSS